MMTGWLRSRPPLSPLAAETVEWPQQGGMESLVVVILALAVVIVLIMLLIRFLASRNPLWTRAGAIRHLGGIGVGQQKSVQLVQVGGKLYVIGVGNDIRLLDKIEDEAEIRGILASLAPAASFPGGKWLSAFRGKSGAAGGGGAPGRIVEEELDGARFQELLHSRIRDLGNRSGKLKDQLAKEEEADGKRQ